ncbi:tubulin nucleotide-binding domain-like protein [Lepidopterella palustris CBS 459.81]|uniref:Tubulin nucleotide-binding domain-like protein n=1 Tax=Lepidopterella palustris CBS 459.81 TaxID=1314670 RepID=A0A8E2DZY7_9PEZI|nr:tubulin nucleotide-binding domain-like protein [Lepidopterella palustris CBS 459.81]
MHEIVTLQFGQQSNYLGTHFWNAQESYFTYPPSPPSPINHDIHFRPGIAPDGTDTFTPRALIYDLKGAFGALRKINALYEVSDPPSGTGHGIWPTLPTPHHLPPIPPSPYQTALDAALSPPPLTPYTVRYWSDYSRVFFHPKSLQQLPEFSVGDQLRPFEQWDVGADLFATMDADVDLLDRDLRPFVEECDGLQGLQIVTGTEDAWGGWVAGWVERLRDEFGKGAIWVWGVGGAQDEGIVREKRLQRLVNSARSLHNISEHASVYIPVSNEPVKSPSYLSLDLSSQWHTSAVQAVALETMTLPSRMRSSDGRGTFQDMEEIFNFSGKRKIAKLEMSIADPDVLDGKVEAEAASAEKVSSQPTRAEDSESIDTQLTEFDIDMFTKDYKTLKSSHCKKEHIFGRAETSRGEWSSFEGTDARDPRNRFASSPIVQRYSAPLLFPLLDSFPSIFNVGSGQSKKLAVCSGLSTSSSVADQVRSLEHIVRRLVSTDERETLSNGLEMIAEEYTEGWDSGTDSGEDDE